MKPSEEKKHHQSQKGDTLDLFVFCIFLGKGVRENIFSGGIILRSMRYPLGKFAMILAEVGQETLFLISDICGDDEHESNMTH